MGNGTEAWTHPNSNQNFDDQNTYNIDTRNFVGNMGYREKSQFQFFFPLQSRRDRVSWPKQCWRH